MTKIAIKRFNNNPLVEPNQNLPWMAKNAFNPGVIIDDDGLWKMLIRGAFTPQQFQSDLGLAFSLDGKQWPWITTFPVLQCSSNLYYLGGIEDPRIVKWIDGSKYIFATARSAAGIAKVGIWKTKNFFEFQWIGTPEPLRHLESKNAAIFPEPINDQVYLIHRQYPHIWIIKTRDKTLRSGWKENQILIRKEKFYPRVKTDTVYPKLDKIGLAGPPVKTPKGWLVIIHGRHFRPQEKEKFVYTLSFVVLDLEDPLKIKYIHPEPILVPEQKYEKIGIVPNVVFSCATVDPPNSDALYIYWGGADTVICGGRLLKKDLPMCY